MLLIILSTQKNMLRMKSMQGNNNLGIWNMKFEYPWEWRKKNKRTKK